MPLKKFNSGMYKHDETNEDVDNIEPDDVELMTEILQK